MSTRPLPGPMEIMEMADGESRTFIVEKWDQGTTQITMQRNGQSQTRTINVLRLHVPVADKKIGMPYWDLTAQTLIAQLLPLLPGAQASKRRIRIIKHGVAPLARFEVALI